MLEDILKNDYIVLTAQSGEEALGYLKKITPDLILLDNTMKGMSGFDVLRVMRKDSVLKSIPVILLSSNEDDSVEIDSLEEGAVDFIRRPYRAGRLPKKFGTSYQPAFKTNRPYGECLYAMPWGVGGVSQWRKWKSYCSDNVIL